MSAYNPPTIISTIYNPYFFAISTSGLTQGQANALYLKKTTADTATALETFSSGILSNSIGSIGGTLALGGNDIINMGTASGRSAAVSINTVGTGLTSIAGNIGQQVQMFGTTAGLNFQFDTMKNSDPTQTVNLCANQTSGVLNICTGPRILSGGGGGINIGSGSGAIVNPINIGGASSNITLNGSLVTIGNGFSTTNLLGTSTIANLAINTVDRATGGQLSIAPTISTSLVLGNTTTCNTSNLGTFTSTGAVIANSGIKSTNVEPTSVSNALGLGGTTTTGDINIGVLQTTGILNIGTGVRNITSSGGVINIGTGSGAVVNPINIGGTGSAINLIGTTTLSKPLILGSTPVANTQLGYGYNLTFSSVVMSSGTGKDMVSQGGFSGGTWLAIGTVALPTISLSASSVWFTSVSGLFAGGIGQYTVTTTGGCSLTTSAIFTNFSGTIYFGFQTNSAAPTVSGSVSIIRIG
jgi:hypothetical protein